MTAIPATDDELAAVRFDEQGLVPAIAQDVDGTVLMMAWMNAESLARTFAEGRTVFVSSHLMSEMALTAEHFIIIGRGRLIADVSAAELAAMGPEPQVLVRTPHGDRLRQVLAADGGMTIG